MSLELQLFAVEQTVDADERRFGTFQLRLLGECCGARERCLFWLLNMLLKEGAKLLAMVQRTVPVAKQCLFYTCLSIKRSFA